MKKINQVLTYFKKQALKIYQISKMAFRKRTNAPSKPRRIFKITFFFVELAFLLFLILVCAGFALFIYFAKDLPRPESFTERPFIESTKIYDRTGKVLLYELYGEEKREMIPLADVSSNLKNAVIATEDANFYSHHGVDLNGILRSAKVDFKLGKLSVGGSTISQQLIRSTFLSKEKTIKRKFREIILTLELERRYSKDQILEWYLNQISFGPNIYGIETASKTYFSKSSKDLTLNESATLAAMIQLPSFYYQNREQLTVRKNYVLDRMVEEGYLKADEADIAKKEEIKLNDKLASLKAPHFVLYVRDYLIKKYGEDYLESNGLKIYTSLNWDFQQAAEKAVKEGAERNAKNAKAYNAALVAMDPKTGEVLSMVGSADWFGESFPKGCSSGVDCKFDPKVNVATYNIGRQPGSSFKPIVYATAFQRGTATDTTVVIDELTNFGVYGGKAYIPHNFDGLFRGPVTLRSALAQSLNIPAVKVLRDYATQSESIDNARKFGITTFTQPDSFYGLAIVLGGGEIKLYDMVSAYSVFATEGMRVSPTTILKIEDASGNIIEEANKTPRKVLDTEAARMINDILSDNNARAPMFGYNSQLFFPNYQVAAKTGTTGDYRDGWCMGYTPSIVAGVWAGNNDNTPMSKEPGSVVAAPIWHQFMASVLPSYPKEYFTKPASLITPPVSTPDVPIGQ